MTSPFHIQHALIQALCGSGALKLIAAATTVNNGKQRAALARQWLRILQVPDDQVPILPYSDCNSAACQLPSGFVAFEDLDDPGVGEESDTPRALLELICKCVAFAIRCIFQVFHACVIQARLSVGHCCHRTSHAFGRCNQIR
jgi:hypothetical protein